MDKKIENSILGQSTDLEDAILEYLKERDMTGLRRYFDDYYIKEFAQQRLQVDQQKLWNAINSLTKSNRTICLKVNFQGGEGVVITPNPPRRGPTEDTSKPSSRQNRAKAIGALSHEDYDRIREMNNREQKRQLRSFSGQLQEEPDPT